MQVYVCDLGDRQYVVCSALGHLYAVSDMFPNRDVYPTFDLEWYPINEVRNRLRVSDSRLLGISKLAERAGYFINACDFDVEGQTIGYNLLRYACGGKEDVALRAKFSTLTKEELANAISEARVGTGDGLARAGRARHVLDFIWGINISRALASSLSSTGSAYKTISMGRVQGPTLSFVVDRERSICGFVPMPYWKVKGIFDRAGSIIEAPHVMTRFAVRAHGELVRKECEGKKGKVSASTKSVFKEHPPPPFSTGDLQKEAFRVLGYAPTRTMRLAQRLYLDAIISYPRTNSQRLPATMNYKGTLEKLGEIDDYAYLVKELIEGDPKPREGDKVDSAHPAVYPTGNRPRLNLSYQDRRLFDLIVRRFLACFAKDAVRERAMATIEVGEKNAFIVQGSTTIRSGWLRFYPKYAHLEDKPMPKVVEGDELDVIGVDCDEMFETPPPRFNQASLLEKMERESIGTKATRAEIISTLMSRGYISGNRMEATELGLSVTEIMQEYSPEIISTSLTREVEKGLEQIESGKGDETELIENGINILSKHVSSLKMRETDIGGELGKSSGKTAGYVNRIGRCPVCGTGALRILRSSKTHKRFVGCTNYSDGGCKASAPLPQRGTIGTTNVTCGHCGWPIIYVRFGRRPWRLCVNARCESKSERRKYAMQGLRQKN